MAKTGSNVATSIASTIAKRLRVSGRVVVPIGILPPPSSVSTTLDDLSCLLQGLLRAAVDRCAAVGRFIAFAPAHHGAGGKELLKLMLTWTCSRAAVMGARSSSGSGSKNIRRTKAT